MKSTMSIPPFPSQELAKLVLGYLAEEQLMTVYDEFLQASPYLDAFKNEYSRIFMRSLRNILAEYMAVKIYVESCKPCLLRKKLFQCSNLLEVVKVLVHNVDHNKIQNAEDERARFESQNPSSFALKPNDCEVCSLTLPSCICEFRQNSSCNNVLNTNQAEKSLNCSVETTSLEDLPGHNSTIKKKHVKVLESTSNCEQNNECNTPYVIEHELSSNNTSPIRNLSNARNLFTKSVEESSQKMEKFTVSNNSTNSGNNIQFGLQNVNTERISDTGTFQNFALDINCGGDNNVNVPDSSTSENPNVQLLVNKDICNTPSFSNNNISKEQSVKGTNSELLRIVSQAETERNIDKVNMITTNNDSLPVSTYNLKSKLNDSKITILSDVIVEKSFSNNKETINRSHVQMPPVLKNATSTPVMQTQTIFINGTPAYKSKYNNYSKEEIMAMPTLILVPASVASQMPPTNVKAKPIVFQNKNLKTSKVPTVLEPLTIDISDSPDPKDDVNANTTDVSSCSMPKLLSETKPAKPVERKNSSLPKDNTITTSCKVNTPHVIPPPRKSSSTPRRTSHIRVLDFATPRRIIHNTITKQNENITDLQDVSDNPHLLLTESTKSDTVSKGKNTTSNTSEISNGIADNKNLTTTESKIKSKYNWDADLRALVGVNESEIHPSKRKSNPKSKKKKNEVDIKDKKSATIISDTAILKRNSAKKRRRKTIHIDEKSEKVEKPVDIPVKPTINIICGIDKNAGSVQESEKSLNKNKDDFVDTPESERLSLQNAIGAKLNISDFLETPYKQALYDIQMETPRFLGPELPGEPVSDIKIMNIPTPRFLSSPNSAVTPKPFGQQATPSSYSSRPTDYSSSGSYYKPDEHDNIPILDNLRCSIPLSKTQEWEITETTVEETSIKKMNACKEKETKDGVKSRPIRQCTKNVSYSYNSPLNSRTKKNDSKDAASSCSEPMSRTNSCEKQLKNNTRKLGKEGYSDSSKSQKVKPDKKKRDSLSLKTKSTFKKETSKSFMKIKPICTTSKRNISMGSCSKKSDSSQVPLVNQIRKRTTNKEKNTTIETEVTPAPTKSRRKSSTPRKLHCSKTFTSVYNSSENFVKLKQVVTQTSNATCAVDSGTEQLRLHLSDNGSQAIKHNETQTNSVLNEDDDIRKIQEYIETTKQSLYASSSSANDSEGSLHIDLIKRGFDVETAKIIERDLLDTPPHPGINKTLCEVTKAKQFTEFEEKSAETDSTPVNLDGDEEFTDDIDLSVYECNEDTDNFIICHHDSSKHTLQKEPVKLKDKFSMEICIEGEAIRLRATPFTLILDQKPQDIIEIEQAVDSISHFDNLYTPIKESVRAQCYDIFDSTLTSLDTPLKVSSPGKVQDPAVTEVVLEVEQIEERLETKEKADFKKRKRVQSGSASDESLSGNKRTRTEAQYLLNSANIQNIDIESVLSKLHGP